MVRHRSYGRTWFEKARFLVLVISLFFFAVSGIPVLLVQYQFSELKNQTLGEEE